MYLGWYDPDKKKPAASKLADAMRRYERKWGRLPSVALVNAADATALGEQRGVEVRVAVHVAPNTFFVGEDDAEDESLAA